ncbi:hypothetical protein F2Q70_00036540 [Brassica cretica]|uniref:Uncharacterized protein n=1 Tax=Brassica cretica TaxID=69181 RepID=A0A8S9JXH7_BRACR|nr:hypothetical protein F2Q70_00036540 [Brassica cretica]
MTKYYLSTNIAYVYLVRTVSFRGLVALACISNKHHLSFQPATNPGPYINSCNCCPSFDPTPDNSSWSSQFDDVSDRWSSPYRVHESALISTAQSDLAVALAISPLRTVVVADGFCLSSASF